MRQQKPKNRVFLVLTAVLMMSYQAGVYAQNDSPADAYYNEHLGGDANTPSGDLPSEAYYNNILRAGPPGGGPGGSGTGGNGGVGVAPIGDGTTCILAAILGYVLIAAGCRYKKRQHTHTNIYTK